MLKKITLILVLASFQISAFAQQTYHLDIKKSKILWNNRKTMGGHYGYILFNSGTLNYPAGDDPKDGIFSIDMNSMRSTDHTEQAQNEKVDQELRKDGYFSIDKYPTATMIVKQITRIGKSSIYKVSGDLTIKGITNFIDFTATIKKTGDVITATAQLEIDRLKWHIDMQTNPKSWDPFAALADHVISDKILVSLNLVFGK
ncbi:YceI family protein [Mucilaginibacter flavus]|uniref:YceI family protein n=1 Tax=Mucilaginibacter flavus TaxID=931504 RepID=UPI0025B45936|nr:YceI family protein [Mucilaginibacter flavus]MDN3579639.1 YceI family protein [Mucilaginibacter flavus]